MFNALYQYLKKQRDERMAENQEIMIIRCGRIVKEYAEYLESHQPLTDEDIAGVRRGVRRNIIILENAFGGLE